MRARGIKADYVWNIFDPLLLKPFMKAGRALFLRRQDPFQDYKGYHAARKSLFSRPGISAFFFQCFFGEYLLRFSLKLRLPLLLGHSVVCDRYLFDAVVTHAANLDYPDAKIRATIRKLLRLLPKPDVAFLIDLPEQVALSRKDDVPGLDYLTRRRRIYLEIAREYGMEVLDGTRDIAYLQERMRSRILGEESGWAQPSVPGERDTE
ncbi:MAG: hypothetical protein HYX90_01810 [Chloroflexi bacterium]|nr:hypothetical protein [Chloroflexota bacterium]